MNGLFVKKKHLSDKEEMGFDIFIETMFFILILFILFVIEYCDEQIFKISSFMLLKHKSFCYIF